VNLNSSLTSSRSFYREITIREKSVRLSSSPPKTPTSIPTSPLSSTSSKVIITIPSNLQASPNEAVRTFCVVHTRSTVSKLSSSNIDPAWVKINESTRKRVKDTLFRALLQETSKNIRNILCDLIADIGSTISILTDEEKEKLGPEGLSWDELMPNVNQLFETNESKYILSGHKIMQSLLLNSNQNYEGFLKNFYELFKLHLQSNDLEIQVTAMGTLAAYLECIQSGQAQIFGDLVIPMFKITVEALRKEEDIGVDAIGHLQDVADIEPRLFKPHWKEMFETVKFITNMELESNQIKENALLVLVVFIERLTTFSKKEPGFVKDVMELIFAYMVTQDQDIDDAWIKPPEGFVEQNDDGEIDEGPVKYCMHLIDRIISSLTEKSSIPILSEIIGKMVQVNDFRYKHSALLALSQVGEYVTDITDMDSIVKFIIGFTQDQHPKVRYGAFHALGQISDDMKKGFQKRFYESVLPAIIQGFQDTCPRVVSHALAALTNFLEGSTKEQITGFSETILENCIRFLDNGISIVKESAICSIAALSEVLKRDFTPYWQKTAEIVFNIFNNATTKEYRQLRGQCIETLTLIGDAVGKEEFSKAAHEIITSMIKIQQNNLEEVDPQKAYLLSGWQRIAIILGKDFVPYLDTILPPIFELIKNVLEADAKKRKAELEDNPDKENTEYYMSQNNEEKKGGTRLNINTSETEEVQLCLDMIAAFADELEGSFVNYVERTVELFLPLLEYDSNEEIRYETAKVLPLLIRSVRKSGVQGSEQTAQKLAHKFILTLWEVIEGEMMAEQISNLVMCIKSVLLETGHFMNGEEVEAMTKIIFANLEASEKRKQENKQYMETSPDFDEDDVENIEEENKQEEELNCAYAELIGGIFQTHKEESLSLAKYIYKSILPGVLDEKQTAKIHKFGIYLIVDMIEHLGVESLPEEWPHLSEALLKFTTHQGAEVRQPAAYGIGVLAKKSSELFKQQSTKFIEALYNAYHIEKTKSDSEVGFGYAKDNIVAAVGEIIKHQSGNLPEIGKIVSFWVECLPLKHDKQEARVQHELLVDIILTNASLIFGDSGERMNHVIKIFAETVNTKFSTDDCKEKIIKVLKLLLSEEASAAMLRKAGEALDAKLQKKLQDIMA
jgi:importin-5